MGVMACGRNGCERIMCDRLILDGSQYICWDCLIELREAKLAWPDKMTAREVREAVEAFMRTTPGAHIQLDAEDIDAEFERLTGG